MHVPKAYRHRLRENRRGHCQWYVYRWWKRLAAETRSETEMQGEHRRLNNRQKHWTSSRGKLGFYGYREGAEKDEIARGRGGVGGVGQVQQAFIKFEPS